MSELRWSFSQWENYAGCPARWKYQSVLKLPRTPPGPAAARGLDMHDRCEAYIKGEIDVKVLQYGDPAARFGSKRPAVISDKYIIVLDQYRLHDNGDRHTELRLAFDSEWYLSGRVSQTSTLIAVLDAARVENKTLHIGEWKSGKPKDTHVDQRKLYSLIGLRRWPFVQEVITTTYYLEDTHPPQRLVVKPTAEQKLRELWDGRAAAMARDKVCAPRPGAHCNWCDYSRNKGGPCAIG